ncbi:GntR family transcriptional regulator [Actinocorallia herbida]|uniref:GntR family transcriptional regulator n=1 Tax=Actinocorallia herbida TaxID=58109 RepID=A0A3N1D2X0_9ACTN|nr:FCD domain-containing protein [Actinocorallia herbida]ROO87887.1 GntR family transcriptional regulator [Actinocorallia herbida]
MAAVGMRPETLAARLARLIENEVIALGWPVGRNLGAEPHLQDRFGVSRSVLREAVRLVEHHQVAAMRRGPGGGLFVTAPETSAPTRAALIYLGHVGTTIEQVVHTRLLLEPHAAALAAARLTEDGVTRLRAAAHDDNTAERWSDPIHTLLGELSGNPALRLFIDILIRLNSRYTVPSGPVAEAAIETARLDHGQIVDAVIAGDSSLAEIHLTAHLAKVEEWLGRTEAVWPMEIEPPPEGKRAEVLADQMGREISDGALPAGTVLGSEAGLLERYGASRAVFREAVRLLEYHSVARTRRGPGGGLVVAEPDPGATVETMALYLDYQGVTGEDLRVVRDAIELGALRLVMARRTDPEVAGRLRAAIARTSEPAADGRSPADLFHTELTELAGNPVLTLFQRILTELWIRHSAGQIPALPAQETAAQVAHIHERVLSALLDGDEILARHRMRRHLEALTTWWH